MLETDSDESWMQRALEVALEAEQRGEVPIGAVIVDANGDFITAASNRTITDNDPTAHAEIIALRTAGSRIGNYRLTGTTIYSTLEPCAMCAGALVNARVKRLVFGAHDVRFGAVETHFRVCDSHVLNHRMEIRSGVRAAECRELMQTFFRARRGQTPLLDINLSS
jgi:tRNA(adenine34) deaminase